MLGTSAQAAAKGIGSICVILLSVFVCSVHDIACPSLCVLRVILPRLPPCFPSPVCLWRVPLLCGYVYVRVCVCARALCPVSPSAPSVCAAVSLSPFPFPAVPLRVWCAVCRGVGVTATYFHSAPGGAYHTAHALQTSVSLVSRSTSCVCLRARAHTHIHPHSHVLTEKLVGTW